MKKLISSCFLLNLAFLLISCSIDQEQPIIIYGEQLNLNDINYMRSIDQSRIIYDLFWDEYAGLFLAYDEPPAFTDPLQADGGAATLWGYGAALTMAASILTLDSTYQPAIDIVYDIVENLEQFRYLGSDMVYYTALYNMRGEPYYDDNAWVVLGLYEIAKALDDDEIMATSRAVQDYVMSGESEHGGVYWKETSVTRHTCSIGPAIIGALFHYEQTGDEKYLEFALRNYEFAIEVLRDPSDGRYYDNSYYNRESELEEVDTTKYTYNTGTMIWAGALLYDLTGQESYKEDALFSAEGGLNFVTMDNSVPFYPVSPWFNLYLLRGFVAVAEFIDEHKYVESMEQTLDYAWEHAKDEQGLVAKNWKLDVYSYNAILDVAGTTESYAILSYYHLNVK